MALGRTTRLHNVSDLPWLLMKMVCAMLQDDLCTRQDTTPLHAFFQQKSLADKRCKYAEQPNITLCFAFG